MYAMPETLRRPGKEFIVSCPVWLLYRCEIVNEIFEAHRFMKVMNQSLETLYPWGIPEIVIRAVLAMDHGLQLAEKERRDDVRRKQKTHGSNGAHGG
jgi:hypothetical protein